MTLNKSITAIILCAGEGLRMGEISKEIPKSLIKVKSLNHKPILHNLITHLSNFGVCNIGIVTGHLGEKIIEHFSSIESEEKFDVKKLKFIDASENYKKGPLYSFLSITLDRNFLSNKQIYLILPGDTIFNPNLLKYVILISKVQSSILDMFPFVFYRNIDLDNIDDFNEKIMIIETIKERSQEILENIKYISLDKKISNKQVKQIIPIFLFNYDFILKIQNAETKASVSTLWEIINYLIENKNKIIAVNITNDFSFFDIDTKQDLIEFNSKKKSGQ